MKYKKEKYMNGIDAMRDAVHYDQGNVVVIETPAREVCTIHGQNWSNHGDGTITEEEHEIADIICHAPVSNKPNQVIELYRLVNQNPSTTCFAETRA